MGKDFTCRSNVNDETEDSLDRCDLFSRSHIEIDVTIKMYIIIEKKLSRRNHCKNICCGFAFGVLIKYSHINFIFWKTCTVALDQIDNFLYWPSKV